MLIAVWVLLGILLLLIVSGAYVFVVGCVRIRETNWLDKNAVSRTPFAKYYSQIIAADQWLREHHAEDVYIKSHDGLKLHGLWVPVNNAKGTVIFFHGYRSTYLVDSSPAFEFYHSIGMNLLIPDQRSHGLSEGRLITFGVKECKDAVNWIHFHNSYNNDLQVVLSGLSMGASTVLFLADEQLPVNVKGMIADCGFTSPKEILSEVYRKVTHLPPFLSLWVTDLFARAFGGFSLSEKDSRKTLLHSKVPVLLVHGTNDGFVPCEMSKSAYDSCGGPKKLLLVEGADHGVSFLVDRKNYSKAIISFLKEHVDNIFS